MERFRGDTDGTTFTLSCSRCTHRSDCIANRVRESDMTEGAQGSVVHSFSASNNVLQLRLPFTLSLSETAQIVF